MYQHKVMHALYNSVTFFKYVLYACYIYALVIAQFRVQYGQNLSSFPYFTSF